MQGFPSVHSRSHTHAHGVQQAPHGAQTPQAPSLQCRNSMHPGASRSIFVLYPHLLRLRPVFSTSSRHNFPHLEVCKIKRSRTDRLGAAGIVSKVDRSGISADKKDVLLIPRCTHSLLCFWRISIQRAGISVSAPYSLSHWSVIPLSQPRLSVRGAGSSSIGQGYIALQEDSQRRQGNLHLSRNVTCIVMRSDRKPPFTCMKCEHIDIVRSPSAETTYR
jgi:hypothetical protein